MGICTSCQSTSASTAKVILQDGRLQEFSYPVKASYVLSKDPNLFICNSEEMDFNGVVSAIRDDEELQLGELYFVLPKTKLCRLIQAEEMAALAVKANTALLKSQETEKCRCRKKIGFFRGDGKERSSAKVADIGSVAQEINRNGDGNRNGNGNGNKNRRNGNRRMGNMHVGNLTVIPE